MKSIRSVVLFLCLGSQMAAGANLLSNGGFETPVNGADFVLYPNGASIGAWTVQFTDVDVNRNHVLGSGLEAHEGNQWLDLNGLDVGGVYQFITTIPGQEYMLSFWYADNPFSNVNGPQAGVPKTGNWTVREGNTFNLLLPIGAFTHSTTTAQDANWTYSGPIVFTATSTNTRIAFSGDTTLLSTGPYLDDVSVSAIPEPGAFFLVGLGLLALWRRRCLDPL